MAPSALPTESAPLLSSKHCDLVVSVALRCFHVQPLFSFQAGSSGLGTLQKVSLVHPGLNQLGQELNFQTKQVEKTIKKKTSQSEWIFAGR